MHIKICLAPTPPAGSGTVKGSMVAWSHCLRKTSASESTCEGACLPNFKNRLPPTPSSTHPPCTLAVHLPTSPVPDPPALLSWPGMLRYPNRWLQRYTIVIPHCSLFAGSFPPKAIACIVQECSVSFEIAYLSYDLEVHVYDEL